MKLHPISVILSEAIIDDYTLDYDNMLFNDDELKVNRIKDIITRDLTETERSILLLYIDTPKVTHSDIGKIMNCSFKVAGAYINNVIKKIRMIYDKRYGNEYDN